MKKITAVLLTLCLLLGALTLGAAAGTYVSMAEDLSSERPQYDSQVIDLRTGIGTQEAPTQPGAGAEEAAALLVRAAEAREKYVDLSSFGFTTAQYSNLVEEALYTRHPEMIWVRSYGWETRNGIVTNGILKYNDEVTPEVVAEYEAEVDALLAQVDPGLSDLETVIQLHDLAAQYAEYCHQLTYTEAYHLLLDGYTVCRGYTKMLLYCLNRRGITARYISNVGHCWLAVKLDGNWYNLDATWDDPDCYGAVRHRYLLKSDEVFALDHGTWQRKSFLTGEDCSCTDTRYDNGAWWDSISQAIYYVAPGEAYYLWQGTEGNELNLMHRVDMGFETVFTIPATWPGSAWVSYTTLRSGLCLLENGLFFNDSKHIYRYDLTTGETETVYNEGMYTLCGIYIRVHNGYDSLVIELDPSGECSSPRLIRITTMSDLIPAWAPAL